MNKIFLSLIFSIIFIVPLKAQNIDTLANNATEDMQRYSEQMNNCNNSVLETAENLGSASFENEQVKQTINCYLNVANEMLKKYYQDEKEIVKQELENASSNSKEVLEQTIHGYISNITN